MILKVKPNRPEAYNLFHEGIMALSQAEQNGIRIDLKVLDGHMADIKVKQGDIAARLDGYTEVKQWRKWAQANGIKFKITNNEQVRHLLYNILKVRPSVSISEEEEDGETSANDEALRDVDSPFTRDLLAYRKLEKVAGTFLTGIRREQWDGWLHTVFNLHLATTYRSTSDSVNFQNFPKRDKEQKRLTRSVMFPRLGHQLGEIDFKGAEVGVGICYHQDPLMIQYWNDPTKDMHRDQACECFLLKPKEVAKNVRHVGKNGFVFPAFYGSYWMTIAPAMWKAIRRDDLKTASGVPLYEHLADNGIKELGRLDERNRPTPGSFMAHIKAVDDRFWNERFTGYTKWKKEWYAAYLKKGYFNTLTGFTCSGSLRKNQVNNYPIQGDAFHCLLWAFIETTKWLRRNKMDTRLMGQVHDSMLPDLHPDERDAVFQYTLNLIQNELPDYWKWIIVPLTAEYEVAPVDGSWAELKEHKMEMKGIV